MKKNENQLFCLTDEHVNVLRQMVVFWDPSESGGPIVDIYSFPYNFMQMGKALGFELKQEEAEQDTPAFGKFASMIETIFEIFIQHASLVPGTFTYKNPLFECEDFMSSDPGDEIDPVFSMMLGETITFNVTDQHIRLLKASNSGWLGYYQTLGMNSKRPYGDMTCFYLDMADILDVAIKDGESCEDCFTEEQLDDFDKLHTEMLYVLQVFLMNADIKPGNFSREDEYSRWEKN